jgi:ATP-dependent RNA helicase DeaD
MLLEGGTTILYHNKPIEAALTDMGFDEWTDIQAQVIPLIQQGKDVIGHSQTGTGKTAAFTVPFLDRIDWESTHVQGLVLCPTRELAVQVKGEIDKIGAYLPKLRTLAIYGGESIHKQIIGLKHKPQIVVGTPGRIIDHINRKLLRLEQIDYLVIDEADEMLKMGFIDDIETILQAANPARQSVMFSATMPAPILRLTKRYLTKGELVSVVTDDGTNQDITQYYYHVHDKHKVESIARLLHVYTPERTLIFCNTKRKVDDVTRELTKKGFHVDKIHGDLAQANRLHVLDKFHSGVLDILVATDVAARGLDIKNVEVVINHDVPDKAEYYVHRIGRTGRIGNKGYSFTLVSKRERNALASILHYTKTTIKKRNVPTPEKVLSVRRQKQYEDLQQVIEQINTNPHIDLAEQLLESYDAIEVVKALLHKLERIDTSDAIVGDINADFAQPTSKDASSNGELNRYHLNVGKLQGLSPRSLADLISKKTKLHSSQIERIYITKTSSFFSIKQQKHNQVMKSLSNLTIGDKRTSVRLAKEQQ